MKIELIREILKLNNVVIKEEVPMKKGLGTSLKLENGCIINCFNNGNHNFQGKNIEQIKIMFTENDEPVIKESNHKVFVVYGHDQYAKTQLEAMLRRWDLEPIILDQVVSSGKTIIEKLEGYTKQVGFGIVLATPDDMGYAKGHEDRKKYRVRQNVILELGMLLSKLGREKVAILLSQAEDMESPSDIDGLIYIPFKESVEETKVSLAKELERNGYSLEISKL